MRGRFRIAAVGLVALTASPAALPWPRRRRHLAGHGQPRHTGGGDSAGGRPRRHDGAHRRVLGGDAAHPFDGGHGPGRPAAHRPAPHRVARPLSQFTQPPPRWLMSHHCRSSADRTADRHRARPSGPPPFPLRSRGRPGGGLVEREALFAQSACSVTREGNVERDLRRIWIGEERCGGNRCCVQLGTERRISVPSCCRQQ